MDRIRLMNLAIEELERQKAAVDADIEAIRAELSGSKTSRPAELGVAAAEGRRHRTPAERKAQSERMRKIWAARRTQAAALKEISPSTAQADRTAVGKRISAAMKRAWAKRKVKTAGKEGKLKPVPKPTKG
jgi:hypothetical protein